MSRRQNSFAEEEEDDRIAAADGVRNGAAGAPAGSAPTDSTRTNDNNHENENDDGDNAITMEETLSGMSRKLSLSSSQLIERKRYSDTLRRQQKSCRLLTIDPMLSHSRDHNISTGPVCSLNIKVALV
jgi:hypothetical protein